MNNAFEKNGFDMFAHSFTSLLLAGCSLISMSLTPFFVFSTTPSQSSCLSYQAALATVLDNSLILKISELEIEANQAEEYQARLWPNPVFSIEFQSGGTGNFHKSWNSAELTYGITQLFELGGKRWASRELLKVNTLDSMWEMESNKLNLILELTHAFIDAFLWQEKWHLAKGDLLIAEQSKECIKEKIDQGKIAPLDRNKYDIKCLQKRMTLIKAQNEYDAAKQKIALLCLCESPSFQCVDYPFFEINSPPPLMRLQELLKASPEWAKSELNCAAAASATLYERKRRYPDLEISAGVSSSDRFRENSFFIEFSLPLPTFNRNQGNLIKAYLKENQASYIKENTQLELESKFLTHYSSWKCAYETAKDFQSLASSNTSIQGVEQGYAEGKFERMELLEARQILSEIHDQYIEALAEYHHKQAETLRLVGQLYRCDNESEE